MLAARANKALLTKLIAAATTYGFTILLARLMSPDAFGKIAFFLNSALFLSVVGACGQQMAVLRFMPPLALRGDPGGVSAFTTRAFRIAAAGTLAVFCCAVGSAFLAQMFGGLPDYSASVLLLGFALIPLVGWIDFQSHLARGFHLIQLSLIPKDILLRAVAGLAVLALYLVQDQSPVSAKAALVVLIGTLVSLTLVQYILLRQKAGLRGAGRNLPTKAPADWRRSIGPFWVTSVSNIFLANVDVMLVAIVVGAKAAGYYFAANRLAMLLASFMTSYNIVLGPMLSEAWHAGRRNEAQSIIHSATVRAA
ncbi:MAG: lipopolysaccharide biosynthesis protein, partial [Paracoccaceae bacterium]